MRQHKHAQVTIDEVARRARVSISTVSRVLNGLDRVHPETRERVLAAIKELSYQPSAYARGLAKQRSQTLGFVIPNISDPFFLEVVRGVEDVTTPAGYGLLVVSQPAATADHRYLKLFTERRVDGLVLVAIDVRRADVEHMLRRHIPVALIQQDIGDDLATFRVDNYGAACALTEHLLEHGRRRIAYIAGSDHTPDNAERLRGLRDTLAAAGLHLPPERLAKGDYLRGSGYYAMQALLQRAERPDGVFAANDQMASDALIAIRERGLRVPEDIALVGFDDVPLASYVIPALTTAHQPIYELGRQAALAVLGALDGAPLAARVVLPVPIVIRYSCGCSS
jgi:DNA-binding LacI/PurR family transcriptional regulator